MSSLDFDSDRRDTRIELILTLTLSLLEVAARIRPFAMLDAIVPQPINPTEIPSVFAILLILLLLLSSSLSPDDAENLRDRDVDVVVAVAADTFVAFGVADSSALLEL